MKHFHSQRDCAATPEKHFMLKHTHSKSFKCRHISSIQNVDKTIRESNSHIHAIISLIKVIAIVFSLLHFFFIHVVQTKLKYEYCCVFPIKNLSQKKTFVML